MMKQKPRTQGLGTELETKNTAPKERDDEVSTLGRIVIYVGDRGEGTLDSDRATLSGSDDGEMFHFLCLANSTECHRPREVRDITQRGKNHGISRRILSHTVTFRLRITISRGFVATFSFGCPSPLRYGATTPDLRTSASENATVHSARSNEKILIR